MSAQTRNDVRFAEMCVISAARALAAFVPPERGNTPRGKAAAILWAAVKQLDGARRLDARAPVEYRVTKPGRWRLRAVDAGTKSRWTRGEGLTLSKSDAERFAKRFGVEVESVP